MNIRLFATLVSVLLCACSDYDPMLESRGQEPEEQERLEPFYRALTGHWMRDHIGNCIMYEEWVSFDPPSGFTFTLVDRNACGADAHGVYSTPGSLLVEDGPVISWDFTAPGGRREMRRFSAAIVDIPRYGIQALNWLAFHRENDSGYASTNRRLVEDPGGRYDQDIHIALSFDRPLDAPDTSVACQMTLTISITVDIEDLSSPESAAETFLLPCTMRPDEETPWVRVTADGFEASTADGSWMDLFSQRGLWDRYPAYLSNGMYDAFRPVLFFEPADPGVLFHDIYFAWYHRMENPPPTLEEFLAEEP